MQLIVKSSPHIKAKHNTRTIMLDVIIALIPAQVMLSSLCPSISMLI